MAYLQKSQNKVCPVLLIPMSSNKLVNKISYYTAGDPRRNLLSKFILERHWSAVTYALQETCTEFHQVS